LGILGVYSSVVAVQELIAKRGLWRPVKLIGVTIGSAVATLVNPYGVWLWITVLASSGRWMKGVDVQWQPTLVVLTDQFRSSPATCLCFVVVLAATVALAVFFAIRPQGNDLPLLAVAAVITASGFAAVRNLPLQAMAIAGPLARRASLIFDEHARRVLSKRRDTHRRFRHELLIGSASLLLAILIGEFSPTLINTIKTPTGAVSFMSEHHLHGKILCYMGWSTYVISREAPESKVFIDGREDMAYPMELLRKYIIFRGGGPGASEVLQEYPPDYVLIRVGKSAYRFMIKQPDWRLIYRDNISALFAQANSAAAHFKGIPFEGHSGPNFPPL
jgi:hypothetical protein